MRLTVTRQQGTALSTPALLDINGLFECYTLEPRMDRSQGKPFAIPSGGYAVALLKSVKFGFVTPRVLYVPGFTAIEIHIGNSPRDTEGCLLIGQTRARDFVGNSREAFQALMIKLNCASAAGESISIEYLDPPPFAVTDPELAL
jgi:hypothetical protein